MGISVEEAIHELRNREEVFVAYSQATKLPYVTCDEETFNDQARIFATEEEIKEYGKQLLEDKILLMGMKYEKKDYPRLYGTLYAIGVNSVLWIDGENQTEVELERIATQRDMSQIDPSRRPLLNPSLELSGIYFMQELRRPVKAEETFTTKCFPKQRACRPRCDCACRCCGRRLPTPRSTPAPVFI